MQKADALWLLLWVLPGRTEPSPVSVHGAAHDKSPGKSQSSPFAQEAEIQRGLPWLGILASSLLIRLPESFSPLVTGLSSYW